MSEARPQPPAARSADPFPHLRLGQGPAVLVVPGLGGTTGFWSAQLPALVRHYTVFAWDQRGSGDRGAELVVNDPAVLAEDVLSLARVCGQSHVLLVGHSMGGAVCQHAALAAPEQVAGLVLSSSWAGPTPAFAALIAARRRILETAGPETYLLVSLALAGPAGGPLDAGALAARAASLDVEAELARLDALAAHDLRARIGALDRPVEILAAGDDRLTPSEMTDELGALLPDARTTRLSGGGHLAPQSEPAAFTAALLEALSRLSSRLPPA